MASEKNQLPIVLGIWGDGSLRIETVDRLKPWWQCKNCGEFLGEYKDACNHVLNCAEYKKGEEVEVRYTVEDNRFGWFKGIVFDISTNESGETILFIEGDGYRRGSAFKFITRVKIGEGDVHRITKIGN